MRRVDHHYPLYTPSTDMTGITDEKSISSNPKTRPIYRLKVASLSSRVSETNLLLLCLILSSCKWALLPIPDCMQCNSPSHGLRGPIVPLSVHQFQKHDTPSNVVFFYEAYFPWPRQTPRCDAPLKLTFPFFDKAHVTLELRNC